MLLKCACILRKDFFVLPDCLANDVSKRFSITRITLVPASAFRQTPSISEIIAKRRILWSYHSRGVAIRTYTAEDRERVKRGASFSIVPLSFFIRLSFSFCSPALNASRPLFPSPSRSLISREVVAEGREGETGKAAACSAAAHEGPR